MARLPVWRFTGFVLCFAVAYFCAAQVGLRTMLEPGGIAVLWPPNAVVLVSLMVLEVRRWPAILLATIAVEIAADLPDHRLLAAAGYGTVNFAEAALAAGLARRLVTAPPASYSVRDLVRLLAIGPLLACGLAAVLGAAVHGVVQPGADFLLDVRLWWLGDATGLLIVGALFLGWAKRSVIARWRTPVAAAELALLGAGLTAAAAWAFFLTPSGPRTYLIFPFLMWAALRFGVPGAAGAVLVAAVAAVGSALDGAGPFSAFTETQNVLAVQALVAAVSVTTLLLAFSADGAGAARERLEAQIRKQQTTEENLRQATLELERTNAGLDQMVAARTAALNRSLVQNQLLLKEIHHRVKNNLQIVASMLSLYGRQNEDQGVRGAFEDVQGHVRAIATAYDVITRLDSFEKVDFAAVLTPLCDAVGKALGARGALSAEVSGVCLVPAETAIALSLVTNELITNAFKHAPGGDVRVSCRCDDTRAVLRVADRGPGLPEGFEFDRASGFGARMIAGLVAQMDGRIVARRGPQGAEVEISIALKS